MKLHQDDHLERAIGALRANLPAEEDIDRSAQAVARRLGIVAALDAVPDTIRSCDDIQHLLPPYRDSALSPARAALVRAHLAECGTCLRSLREGAPSRVDWSAPRQRESAPRRPLAWSWAVAFSSIIAIAIVLLYRAYWAVPPGVRAEVTSLDGSAYVVSGAGERSLSEGAELREGDRLRTSGSSHAILRLADGSTVEINQRSALQVRARGRNMTIALDSGAVIVQAARRELGHLYVNTPDCRVAVKGTVFAVDSGLKGSRVSVLQGTVDVTRAGLHSVLRPGDQIATNDNLGTAPLAQQIAWSPDRAKYLALLAQFSALQQRIEQIPFPQPRYTSDILPRVPQDTLLYVSIPNLGDFVTEANSIFQDQLRQSPELQQWWSQGRGHNAADLDSMVAKVHDISQYLGQEIVIAAQPGARDGSLAVIANVQRSGLADELAGQFGGQGLTVFSEQSLATASDIAGAKAHEYALVREHEAVFSNSVATLKQWNAQLSAGPTGFAAGDFGKQIAAAYDRGAGIILAADLQQMMASAHARHAWGGNKPAPETGMEGARYLIAEHREINQQPQNHLNVSFSGTRQRVASWLAAPAPMGSLAFVTPNAAIAVAVLSKDPASIADDILAMTAQRHDGGNSGFSEAESELQINLRDDLIATLGGEFLLSLDGPVLPTPSWKAVIEVNDPARLENTLERLAAVSVQRSREGGHSFAIEPSDLGGQKYYAVRDANSGTVMASYTFFGGYMIAAADRALLIDALRAQASGNSLARSPSFRATLPRDENDNYSAVAYQNLSPVLTPLLSQLSGESAAAIRKLAVDAHPTAICAWGKDDRIEVASDSRLFGFDFLTLGALLDSRNKFVNQNVVR